MASRIAVVKIARNVDFNPIAFIGKRWKVLKRESDKRATELNEVDFARVNLETSLNDGESRITGEEKIKRLRAGGNILLDAGVFLALWNEEGHKTLNWLYENRGVTYLDFFGTILEGPDGRRFVLCLWRHDDGRWSWIYDWLGNIRNSSFFSASLHAGQSEWLIWKTTTLGTHNSIATLRAALKAGGHKVRDWANDILGKIVLSPVVTTVDLVMVTVRDLGFTAASATTTQIFAKAKELGLEFCPAEVGPQLRLQYKDQPNGECLWIMMEPISASDKNLSVFGVERDGDRFLLAGFANPYDLWRPGYQLIFRRPRK